MPWLTMNVRILLAQCVATRRDHITIHIDIMVPNFIQNSWCQVRCFLCELPSPTDWKRDNKNSSHPPPVDRPY